MNYHEKIERYSSLYSNGLGRYVNIKHKRTRIPTREKDNNGNKIYLRLKIPVINNHTGKIIKICKASLKLLLNNEQIITIGFRTIKESVYLDQGLKIKASLYWGVYKPKKI